MVLEIALYFLKIEYYFACLILSYMTHLCLALLIKYSKEALVPF